ncbi:acyltransferase family protein [Hymenobacter jejuensis]|uniref:Acyltransferase n=1 Tax=Hymenobacter jejuensis TaxID=2502781 RepID=A0A5B7ZUZ8_9BACT|nr:acyltransferase [Hymenobacter jejuensis]QDA58790.1 acyltransferase [Hymenobacter jejuensis]
MTAIPKQYFKPLTGVRAIAAFMVFLCHFSPYPLFTSDPYWRDFFGYFHVGVTFFFTLSGFLIASRYIDTSELTWKYFKQYLLNRFARIYPIYFLLTFIPFIYLLRFPLDGAAPEVPIWMKYLANITLLKGFSATLWGSGLGQAWSLTVEECFYLSAPILFFFLTKFRSHQYLVFLASGGVVLSLGLLLTQLFHGKPLGLFADYTFLFSWTFFGRFTEFFIGVALAIYLKRHPVPHFKNDGRLTYVSVLFIFLIIALLAALKHYVSLDRETITAVLINNVVLPVFIACFYYGLIAEKTRMAALLATSTADLLGKSSYAFYLIHAGVLSSEISIRLHMAPLAHYFVHLGLLITISIALYRYVEEPLNQFIRHRFLPATVKHSHGHPIAALSTPHPTSASATPTR